MWHIEKAAIVRTVYWSIFSSEIISSIEPYSDIYGTLHNPCIYNCALFKTLAYLVPDSSSKACWTCHMIMHIQSPCIEQFIQAFSRIFMHIQRYWCTSSQKHRRATRGRPPLSVLKIKNSALILKRNSLIVSTFELNFLLTHCSPVLLIYTLWKH